MRKARGGSNETNKRKNQPVREHTQQYTHPGGGGGVAGGVGGEGGEGGERGEGKKEQRRRRSAARSSVSFSSEKETEEPLPLSFIVSPTWLDQFGA